MRPDCRRCRNEHEPHTGPRGREQYGFLKAHRWLIARRLAQLGFFMLFATGPWFGIWITKGTLASSLTLDLLPLTDPLILLQSLVARHPLGSTALIGAAIVLAAYLVLGGRLYCSWVCPINPATDLAAWARRRLGIETDWKVRPETRNWVLGAVLAASAITGTIAFELVNPITMLHRGLLFGASWGLVTVLAIFLFDLFVAKHGWCGHLCPVGAFYGLAQPDGSGARLGARSRPLRRLHGLLRRLPGNACHFAGAEGRAFRRRAGDPVGGLHRLRALHRRLPRACLPILSPLRRPARPACRCGQRTTRSATNSQSRLSGHQSPRSKT